MKPWKSNDRVTLTTMRTDFSRAFAFFFRFDLRSARMRVTIPSSGAVHFSRFYKDYPTVVYVSLSTLYMTLLLLRVRNFYLFIVLQFARDDVFRKHFLAAARFFCPFRKLKLTLHRYTRSSVAIFRNDPAVGAWGEINKEHAIAVGAVNLALSQLFYSAC